MGEEPVNIICMKWGTRYPAHDVNVLFRSIGRHLSRPFRFVCLTFKNRSGKNCTIHNWSERRKRILRPRPEIGNSSIFRFEAGRSQ